MAAKVEKSVAALALYLATLRAGAVYLPLVGAIEEVELAVATRADEQSPQVARVVSRMRTLLGTPEHGSSP